MRRLKDYTIDRVFLSPNGIHIFSSRYALVKPNFFEETIVAIAPKG